MNFFQIIAFCLIQSVCFAQNTTLTKVYYAGSIIKIPEGRQWTIEKAFISSGDGYNILISETNFKSLYKPGDTLAIPYYIAQMELLSDRTNVSYILTITEDSAPE